MGMPCPRYDLIYSKLMKSKKIQQEEKMNKVLIHIGIYTPGHVTNVLT